MAIGKTNVAKMPLNRVKTETTPSGDELVLAVFNGTQRDQYVAKMCALRDTLPKKDDALTDMEMVKKASPELIAAFTRMQYAIIASCVMDGDAFGDGRLEPLFDSPEHVADTLTPTQITEWAELCEKVNGLGEKAIAEEAGGFFGQPKGGSGSVSPEPVAEPTSPN